VEDPCDSTIKRSKSGGSEVQCDRWPSNLIVNHVPAPRQQAHADEDFRMLATTLGADPFIGRLLTGRVESGTLRVGATVPPRIP